MQSFCLDLQQLQFVFGLLGSFKLGAVSNLVLFQKDLQAYMFSFSKTLNILQWFCARFAR
jgi:hypothetical protein